MRFEKEIIQRAVKILMDKARGCFDLAQSQHTSADRQNANADKLEALSQSGHFSADNEHASAEKLVIVGQSLEAAAAQLIGEIEIVAGRTSPILRTLPTDIPAVRSRVGRLPGGLAP
jgi:hypothetical protein